MKAKRMAYLLLVTLLLLVSCTRNAQQSIPIGEQQLPDMVMEDAVYVMGQGGQKPLAISATTITIYRSEKGTIIEKAIFDREDFNGQCEHLVISQDAQWATLEGNVTITKKADAITIRTQNITWDQESESFSCDGEVEISYGEGTTLRAIGLYAKLSENLFEFSEVLEGRIDE